MTTQTLVKKAAPAVFQKDSSIPAWDVRNVKLRHRFLRVEKQLAHLSIDNVSGYDPSEITSLRNELNAIGTEFIELNRGLAVMFARKFNMDSGPSRHPNALHDNERDYRASALAGLWESFLRFDPYRDVAFSTFAYAHIKGSVLRTVRATEFPHLSQTDFYMRQQILLARGQLVASLGRNVTQKELALSTGLPLEKVTKILEAPAPAWQHAFHYEDPDYGTVEMEACPAYNVVEPEVLPEDSLEPLLDTLSDIELWMFLARSTTLGPETRSLVEVGNDIGLGREIARRAETRARVRLAATAIADEVGRLATSTEVADMLNIDATIATDSLESSFPDLHARLLRCRQSLADSINAAARTFATARLNRCGEEFVVVASSLIYEAAGRYLASNETPIGLAVAAYESWEAFLSWNSRETKFHDHLRSHLVSSYKRARQAAPVESLGSASLWYTIRRQTSLASV